MYTHEHSYFTLHWTIVYTYVLVLHRTKFKKNYSLLSNVIKKKEVELQYIASNNNQIFSFAGSNHESRLNPLLKLLLREVT